MLFAFIIKGAMNGALPKYPVFPSVYNKVNIILETETKNIDDIVLKVNEGFYSIPNSKGLLNKTVYEKADNISILVNKNFKNEIKNII